VVTVQAATVGKSSIERVVSAEAVVYPLQQAVITPKISSPVRAFYVNRGSRVRKGQLLAALENKDLSAAVADSRGAYDQAQATYESTVRATLPEEIQKAELDAKAKREALDAEQKVYDSRRKLYEQGALARKDFDQSSVSLIQARNDYEIAQKHLQALRTGGRELELKSAKAQLSSAQAKYEGAQAQLAYAEIRSPIDGVVTDRPLYPGEMASAGSPLVTIIDASRIQARAHIALQDATLLKPGDPATISPPGQAGDEGADVPGRVTLVSAALDPSSTTVEVWIQARNPEGRLKAGSTVKVSAVARKVPNALVIPGAAILTAEDGSTTVMVVGADGKAHQRPVKTGIHAGDQVQVTDGLQEGERVVTVGAYGLPDNTAVQVESSSEKSAEGDAKKDSGKEKD
jgi:HlyD family secretion protein